jgi:ppGpp synthetase/RelA/SpoT-type nucleotidyltranferase
MSRFSKTQIDKLGERLRDGEPTDDDLRVLDEYRRGFDPVYEAVLERLEGCFHGEISGRAAKTTESIVRKLRREPTLHVRLSQMQDICGLRIIVQDVDAQDAAIHRLVEIFPGSDVQDRRENPSHGYRAVHVIAPLAGLQAEIQVRSVLQHMWAQFCENLADKLGIEVKYGGNESVQRLLNTFSEAVRNLEEAERGLVRESPYADALAREDFIRSFHSLIRFVGQTPGEAVKGHDVLPH